MINPFITPDYAITILVPLTKILYLFFMQEQRIITGVKVTQQMSKAKDILKTQVIPREKKFQELKRNGSLSPKLKEAIIVNA